ncbi:MAG TPA: hypothetical protein VJ952_00775, partial [Opitutales bacterium]|nr:hypothetical protein [Opitutales bacterium]
SDAGLKHLVRLKRLRSISLQGTQVTADGIAYLNRMMPGIAIGWDGEKTVRPRETKSGFHPEKVVELNPDPATNKTFFDLDQGNFIAPHPQLADWTDQSSPQISEAISEWMASTGADVVIRRMTRAGKEDDLKAVLVDGFAAPLAELDGPDAKPDAFDTISAKTVLETVEKIEKVMEQGYDEVADAPLWGLSTDRLHVVKTREGAIALVEMAETSKGSLRMRYKLVREAGSEASYEAHSQEADSGVASNKQTKSRRFVPQPELNKTSNWAVLPKGSAFHPEGWGILANLAIGKPAPVRHPGEDEPFMELLLLDGNASQIRLKILDLVNEVEATITLPIGESSTVLVGGRGYKILFPEQSVGLDQADTTPLAPVLVFEDKADGGTNDEYVNATHREIQKDSSILEAKPGQYRLEWENGMTFEVVGLLRNPRESKTWYRPDGTRSEKLIGEVIDLGMSAPKELNSDQIPPENEFIVVSRSGSKDGERPSSWVLSFNPRPLWHTVAERVGASVGQQFSHTDFLVLSDSQRSLEQLNLEVELLSRDAHWETVAIYDGETTKELGSEIVVFSPPRYDKEVKLYVIDVMHNLSIEGHWLRLLAKMKDGQSEEVDFHAGYSRGTLNKGFAIIHNKEFKFKDVEEYVLQRAERLRGRITGISLPPRSN